MKPWDGIMSTQKIAGRVIASYILKIIMIILFILALLKGELAWTVGAAIALFLTFVPTILERNFHITLPFILEFLIVLALFLHIGGNVFNFYYVIPRYDDIAHFVSSSLVAFIAFTIVYILDKYWEGLHMDMYAMAYLVIVTTMAFGVVWEVFEWTADLITGGHEQWSLNDTMSDLVIDSIGGIVMAFIGIILIKTGRWDRMTEDMGKGIDSVIIHRKKE